MKSEKLLKEFTEFCKKHPELRFWQALTAWSDHKYVNVSHKPCNICTDTFYFEDK